MDDPVNRSRKGKMPSTAPDGFAGGSSESEVNGSQMGRMRLLQVTHKDGRTVLLWEGDLLSKKFDADTTVDDLAKYEVFAEVHDGQWSFPDIPAK